MDLTAAEASKIPLSSTRRIVFTGIGAGGYQTGEGEYVVAHAPASWHDARSTHPRYQAHCLVPEHRLRFLDIVSPGDLDIVNENIRANNGVFSFRLMRFCTTGNTRVTASAYGVSFPGTQIGNVTYYSMSPSYADGKA